MITFDWQFTEPVQTVIFDCDGTLSTLEGIDELARQNGVGQLVESLTAEAMARTGLTPELYAHRLSLVKPTRDQVDALGALYFQHRVPEADLVMQVLRRLRKNLYIFSAGLAPAVIAFGEQLGVPATNIFAVSVGFHPDGTYRQFDMLSPLTGPAGKAVLLQQLQKLHPGTAQVYIGDGMNDLVVLDQVARFVGYGGVYQHARLLEQARFYIQARSMAPLLPLVLTAVEVASLEAPEQLVYESGLSLIQAGEVIIR